MATNIEADATPASRFTIQLQSVLLLIKQERPNSIICTGYPRRHQWDGEQDKRAESGNLRLAERTKHTDEPVHHRPNKH